MDLDGANSLRWRPRSGDFYEVWFLTLNSISTGTGAWLRYVLQASDEAPDGAWLELWATVFGAGLDGESLGLMRRLSLDSLEAKARPFAIRMGEAEIRNGAARGELTGGGHSISWDLEFDTGGSPFLHFPEELYGEGRLPGAVLAPHLNTRVRGTLTVDERTIELVDDPGQQSHVWGRKHPPHSCWAHCSYFVGQPDAEMQLLCIPESDDALEPPPTHVVYVRRGDEEIRLLSVLDDSISRHDVGSGRWSFDFRGDRVRVVGEIQGDPAQLVEAEYEEPDGAAYWVVHHDLCDSQVEVSKRSRVEEDWTPVFTLRSQGTTHCEWGDWAPHTGIENHVWRGQRPE